MTRQDIHVAFTLAVADWVGRGYILSPDTMQGAGEVDLTNGNELIRVYIDRDLNEETFADQAILTVGRFSRDMSKRRTVWNHKLEIISRRIFESTDNRGREYVEITPC